MKTFIVFAFVTLSALGALAENLSQSPATPAAYPPGPLGEMVKLGQDIIMHTDTHPLSRGLVGNKLTCSSCHIDGGRTNAIGASFIGTAAAFPAFSAREGAVLTLQDRNANCFMRSMNGTRPAVDSQVSIAIAAYITWLSEGAAIKMNPIKPVNERFSSDWPNKELVALMKRATHANYLHGQEVFVARCAACHSDNGEGTAAGPPVWGSASYNTGAGVSKPPQMASWIEHNMPPGNANLLPQEIADVTIYIEAQPHPAFDLKNHLPAEASYNAKILDERSTVRSNFKEFGLDIDTIRGDQSAD
jgi:thiosulfate dehydrogenase